MVKQIASFGFFYIILLSFGSATTEENDSHNQQVYIVYMGSLPSQPEYSPTSHHISILQEATAEISIKDRMVRSYKKSFNGFAARLTETERQRIIGMEGVVSAFPSRNYTLQTTVSWDFMGLKEGKNTKRNPDIEGDTIIGVIDGGIWPESESFSDEGFGPPPKKWKGVCSGGKNFTCNNKVIGARDYTHNGARDYNGHGTHTSSIAAGNAIMDTSFYELGKGTVRGGVPASRIVTYNVCRLEFCFPHDILAAFDDAIEDGVDIITISIASKSGDIFIEDPIAIGAFHAMAKGILTVAGAGNSGPKEGNISSVAPWIFSIAASNTNRAFLTKVNLGDGKILIGRSVNSFDLNGTMYPLVFGKSIVNSSACSVESAERCDEGCLQKSLVKGKILLCNSTTSNAEAQYYGAIAIIALNYLPGVSGMTSLPSSRLSQQDINSIISYVNSESSPTATILKSEAIFNQTAPVIASFSSRGPNAIATDILKPDVTAPGVEILAAFSPLASLLPFNTFDKRHVKYAVLSGTSMSCPHVTGVAAYVKTFHPQWSPSMIKSAIMTTAWSMNALGTGYASTEFAYGNGHVDPIAAINPGLVYDLTKADYIAFLCGMNYSVATVKIISGEAVNCTQKILPRNLNYPSMSTKLAGSSNSSFVVSFNRMVTNVGTPISTYKSKVVSNHGTKLNVTVSPSVMSFKTMNEKQAFTVTVSGTNLNPQLPSSADIIWSDGIYNVRSPIVVY